MSETTTVRVTVTQEDAEYLERMGNGNRSAAMRACITWHKLTHPPQEIMLAFVTRCQHEGKSPTDVLSEMMEGYAKMPTAADFAVADEGVEVPARRTKDEL